MRPFTEAAPELDGHDPAALVAATRAAMDGVTFGAKGDERFHLDPIPRVIAADAWDRLAAGLGQRVRGGRRRRRRTTPPARVPLSCHDTVIEGALEPRHVDLRPFVFLGPDGAADVLPGGLTRVAFDDGALVVNSSQNGGAKDTWVLR
jgi:uncharacterized circularly permuted ATP-grasp superfamily protein